MARVDYDRMAPVYDAGRGRTLDQLRPWREALTEFLPQPCGCRSAILDLGAGTGQWAAALSRWFELPVVAVEPSAGMRAAAAAKHLDRVRLIAGRGEAVPLAAGACSAAWLSLVLHHLDDPARCAEELRRVLCPHGLVLLRSAFPDAGELLDLRHPGAVARPPARMPKLGARRPERPRARRTHTAHGQQPHRPPFAVPFCSSTPAPPRVDRHRWPTRYRLGSGRP